MSARQNRCPGVTGSKYGSADTTAGAALSCDHLQEFLVTPLQLGMPYSRPRYYALGQRKRPDDGACSFPMPALPSGKPFAGPPGPLLELFQAGKGQGSTQPAELAESHVAITPLSEFLDREAAPEQTAVNGIGFAAAHGSREDEGRVQQSQHHASAADSLPAATDSGHREPGPVDSLPQSSTSPSHQDNDMHVQSSAAGKGSHSTESNHASPVHEQVQRLSSAAAGIVPQSVIEQWGQSLDIVGPDSRRCNCFTKTYFRWVKASLCNLLPIWMRQAS